MAWVDLVTIVAAESLPSKNEIAQVRDYIRRKAKARFYADENFPNRAIALLRNLGVSLTTARDAALTGHPDENHCAYALKHGYVLVTCDRDYLDNRRFPLIGCPAIFVFNFGDGLVRDINLAIRCLGGVLSAPQFYDKWAKIDATPSGWTESLRHTNGTTSRSRKRIYQGRLQQWVIANRR